MKMVCTAGLLAGITAGPEATPGGTVKLKSAGSGLGALAGASCKRACPSLTHRRAADQEKISLSSKAWQGNAVTICHASSVDAMRSLTSMRHAVLHETSCSEVFDTFRRHTNASPSIYDHHG